MILVTLVQPAGGWQDDDRRGRARHALRTRLGQALGEKEASTLTAHLPPAGWAEVATKSDLDALRHAVETDIGALEARLEGLVHREIARLEASFHDRFDALRSEQHVMRSEQHAQTDALRAEQHAQTRTLFFSILGSNLTIAALVFTAAQVV